MEASRLIFRQPPCLYYSDSCRESKYRGGRGVFPGFYDHCSVQYYHNRSGKSSCEVSSMGAIRCEKVAKEDKGPMKMKMKKQMKLLKGLSRDLYAFSHIGFGLDSNLDQDLLHQVKGTTILETADLLLEQLEKLRAEKQLEKKRRQERKKQMRNSLNLVQMSSSSSESSSDSECGEVIDMKGLKLAQPKQEEEALPPVLQNYSPISPSPFAASEATLPTEITSLENSLKGALETECSSKLEVCMGGKQEEEALPPVLQNYSPISPSPFAASEATLPTEITSLENSLKGTLETECSSKLEVCMGGKREEALPPVLQNYTPISPSPFAPSEVTLPTELTSLENSLKGTLETECSSKLEVCMGGKCKKSGAAAILNEFEKVVGIEVAVSGCKCMGKCKDGPNVRVQSGEVGNNPLFIGVGLEDVNMIVSNLLGDNREQPGFAAAA